MQKHEIYTTICMCVFECLMIHFVGKPEYEYKLLVCHFEHYKCTIARKRHTHYTHSHSHSVYSIPYRINSHTFTEKERENGTMCLCTRTSVLTICDMNVRSLPSTAPNCLALFIVFTFNEPILMLNERNTSHKLYIRGFIHTRRLTQKKNDENKNNEKKSPFYIWLILIDT